MSHGCDGRVQGRATNQRRRRQRYVLNGQFTHPSARRRCCPSLCAFAARAKGLFTSYTYTSNAILQQEHVKISRGFVSAGAEFWPRACTNGKQLFAAELFVWRGRYPRWLIE